MKEDKPPFQGNKPYRAPYDEEPPPVFKTWQHPFTKVQVDAQMYPLGQEVATSVIYALSIMLIKEFAHFTASSTFLIKSAFGNCAVYIVSQDWFAVTIGGQLCILRYENSLMQVFLMSE